MSTAVVIAQIETCLHKAERLKPKVDRLHPTDEQWDTLLDLTSRLSESTQLLREKLRLRREVRSTQIQNDAEKYRSQAITSRHALCENGTFKATIFRRNLLTIFGDTKISMFDSARTRWRKEAARRRNEAIRGLNPDAIVTWSIAFEPSLWASGKIASDVFETMTEDLEAEPPCEWPPAIMDTLDKLQEEEGILRESREYKRFRETINLPYRDREAQPLSKKRKRNAGVGSSSERSSSDQRDNENQSGRQIQYMFSKAPVDKIPLLGPLLSNAIQASNQWKMERNLDEPITDCCNALLPEGEHEDISITLCVGRREGVQMIDLLKQRRTWSALPNHLSLRPQIPEEQCALRPL
ncbi:hypothetical protein Aspvir_004367 [Aspergillus viridinutans]|uniref:Uncharacterized protein n=1 Tax=Aspergillus viridinutans TaxID=75553 RepID=A0A9P3BQA9_ASPVI|nr:uncharacterized protein Aspvir_004367 [Aspergillus viridinutans]GIK00345.1 hypothetical protein Aspvir_004367 [Aspergillus viridinutans]